MFVILTCSMGRRHVFRFHDIRVSECKKKYEDCKQIVERDLMTWDATRKNKLLNVKINTFHEMKRKQDFQIEPSVRDEMLIVFIIHSILESTRMKTEISLTLHRDTAGVCMNLKPHQVQ